MTPRISVIVATARRDFPWKDRPDLHTCDPAVLTLLAQEGAPPFEIIVTDALWGERDEPATSFPTLAVGQFPQVLAVRPVEGRNEWHRRGRPALGQQVNEAAAMARGDIVVCLTEACMCPPWLLRRISEEHEAGRWPNLLFVFDGTYAEVPKCKPGATTESPDIPSYNLLGHTGRHVLAEHRWNLLRGAERVPCAWSNHFGYFTMPRSVCHEIGGYDEAMDGDRDTADVDIGSRLDLAGHGDRLHLVRDCFVVEAIPETVEWCEAIPRKARTIKCNHALIHLNRATRRIDVRRPITAANVAWMRSDVCAGRCQVWEACREAGVRWPFDAGADPELLEFWRAHAERGRAT